MTDTPNVIDVRVGLSIRRWRIERQMTVLYVAAVLGVSGAALAEMEAGRKRFGAEELRKLCDLLAISPAAVYEERDPRLGG